MTVVVRNSLWRPDAARRRDSRNLLELYLHCHCRQRGDMSFDTWILAGKVYNVTPYMDFHPGGWDELIKGAGRDATDMFNDVHSWVNYESMLAACLVGKLVDRGNSPLNKLVKKNSVSAAVDNSMMLPPSKPGKCGMPRSQLHSVIVLEFKVCV